ncbi:hypothetical protein EDD53_1511 [Pacificibacter maritimus]|uniref:Uncharacterized protein n=1 Tax=Pacificibacter maritimus TaxID=762213 RepID=A0A3N4UQ34_9RHOB|nr:hypothetical protein [Pacificibacter maritimus]RPE67107.1 hypothetical protein EDD53_1511 [Pacificibacter maritimus]
MADMIEIQNVNTPEKTSRVNAAKYNAMKAAILQAFAQTSAPQTAAQLKEAAKSYLPQDLFPEGATAGWWLKAVQLDLEAKGVMQRHATKPLTFSLT